MFYTLIKILEDNIQYFYTYLHNYTYIKYNLNSHLLKTKDGISIHQIPSIN